MKKQTLFAAVALLAIGCENATDVDQIGPQDDGSGQQVTVSLSMAEAQTRIALAENTDDGIVELAWADGDALGSWESGFTGFRKFTMVDGSLSDNGDSAQFEGTVTGETLRLIYPYSSEAIISDSKFTIDLSEQTPDMDGDGLSALTSTTYMISSEIKATSPVSENMKHIGALIKLTMSFKNLPLGNIKIKSVELLGVPSSATVDLTKEVDDEDFIVSTTMGSITATIQNSPYISGAEPGSDFTVGAGLEGLGTTEDSDSDSDSSDIYSVMLSTIPFTVECEESLGLNIVLESSSGALYTETFTITNSGTEAVEFKRATYNTISKICDLEESIANEEYPHTELANYTVYSRVAYSPSQRTTYYTPIKILYSSGTNTNASTWSSTKSTRVLEYVEDFTPDYSAESYLARTNKYGSDMTQFVEATGRFYTYKDPATGRWWIVDPEGYRHIQRGLNTVKPDNGVDGQWALLWGGDVQAYLKQTQEEFYEMGIHGTGAFTTSGYYQYIQEYNTANPDTPLTIAPSMGWLSAFKSATGYDYPTCNKSDDSYCRVCFAYYPEWEEWCATYAESALALYKDDPNVFGFFSDNEINFTSANYYLLDEVWYETDATMPAKAAAIAIMEEHGYTEAQIDALVAKGDRSLLQGDINLDFAGRTAELYYGGISRGAKAYDPGIMYLGSRFHGTPKYLESIILAAGKYCDIISINYYGTWDVELTTYVKMWETAEAPFMVSEFYIKGTDQGHANDDGAGDMVQTQAERAFWYQHFTLGLLESSSCVGWHWFRYMDDQTIAGSNRGFYSSLFEQYDVLVKYARELNYNTYDIIDYFDQH